MEENKHSRQTETEQVFQPPSVKYLAYVHALQHGLYFFYGDADVVTHGSILAAGDKVVTAVYRNQNLEGFACADGSSDSGSDFPQKGVGEYDTDRPHDQIGIGRPGRR